MFKAAYKHQLDEAKKRGVSRFVVGAIVTKGKTALLLKRKSTDFLGGIYELPSGEVEEGETFKEALKREIREEVGLKIKRVNLYVGSFDYLSKTGQKTRQFNFWIELNDKLQLCLNPDEHVGHTWVTKNNLKEYKVTNNVKKILRKFWSRNY